MSTLLESADRHGGSPPPPPVPESRNYYDDTSSLESRERQLRDSIVRLQERAGRLERRTQALRERSNHGAQDNGVARRRASAPRLLRRLHQSPEPALATRSSRRDHGSTRRTNLPTPPLDHPDADSDSLFVPDVRHRLDRPSHPLSNSWSPDSPVDGLGDRNRSPTPADGWEVMRSTITPDATLPSADSSFTSAAASQSFTSNPATEPDHGTASNSSFDNGRNTSDDSDSDSASSVDPEDLVCDDDDQQILGAESFADDMYDFELSTPEGRDRISAVEQVRARDGNRFALAHEPDRIDIGFRLIEDALDTEEGRERLLQVGVLQGPEDIGLFEDVVDSRRDPRNRRGQPTDAQMWRDIIESDELPVARAERYSAEARSAVREATAQVHDYFRRYTADALQTRHSPRSPPPQYEPLSSHPDVDTFASRDGPEPHPVSPPTQRSQNEVADALLSGDETDLGAMRRVVERLARRDDVPEEWWMSMGLNLSRTRPRTHSPRRSETAVVGNRVRAGRIERGTSRL